MAGRTTDRCRSFCAGLCITVVLGFGAASPIAFGAQEADAAAAQPAFDVMEYRVQGNSTLPAIEIEKTVYPYLGPGRSMKDVESARLALETVYHDRGFNTVFVEIPEQTVDEGIVRLHVTQGRLHQVTVNGARYFSGRQIKALLPAAEVNAVPNLPALQAQLTDLNTQTRDRTVLPVLRAGPQPGTVDLALKVDDHLPLHGALEVNNQSTAGTEPLRLNASLSYDNLFGRLDSLSLQYQTSPQERSQVDVFAGGYTARLNDEGTRLALLFIDSKSSVASLGTLGVLGKGKIATLKLSQPLSLTSATSQTFSAGVDYKNFAQSILVGPDSTYKTPISYFNWSLGYAITGRSERSQWSVNTALNLGLRGVRNESADFANKRYLAPANYSYLRADASYLRELPAKFTLLLRVGGQYTAEPLISNEAFTIGGSDSTRGYFEAEAIGDLGVRGSVQLGTPTLALFTNRLQLSSFVFFDAARASTLELLGDEPSNVNLRSWGAGLSLDGPAGLGASLIWADPLLTAPATSEHFTRKGDARWLFTVHDSF